MSTDHPQCNECGALMAADQRYCLSCGARRSDRRVPAALLAPTPTVLPAPAPVMAEPPSLATRIGGGWGVAALVLLALGVGVAIGELGGDEPAPVAARAPVVSIAAGALAPVGATVAPVAAAPVAVTGPTGTTDAASDPAESSSSSDDAAPAAEVKKKLAEKEQLSPDEFQKQSKKLPKTTGTGGKPPAKDNAAPGAGSEAESIG